MSIDKIQHTEKTNISNEPENSADNKLNDSFKKLLHKYIEKSNQFPRTSTTQDKKLEEVLNHDSYGSFNELKINHLGANRKKSDIIQRVLTENNTSRKEKIEQVKARLKEGFYQRDDIIEETAGKILDSIGR